MTKQRAQVEIAALLAPNIQTCAKWNYELFMDWAKDIIEGKRGLPNTRSVDNDQIEEILNQLSVE